MGSPRITQERYDEMLGAFRESPANVRGCARRASVDRRTARKAWFEGWPERGFHPIRDVLDREQAAARARLAELREAELKTLAARQAGTEQVDRAKAAQDATESRTEEAAMVRAARRNAIGLMASVNRLLRGANALAERVEGEVGSAQLKPNEAASLFREIASTARQSNEAAKLAMHMERTLLGEPERWTGVAVHVDMTPGEAVREIELAQKAAARARRLGLVTDIEAEGVDAATAQALGAAPAAAAQ